jgi:hypothetical protein
LEGEEWLHRVHLDFKVWAREVLEIEKVEGASHAGCTRTKTHPARSRKAAFSPPSLPSCFLQYPRPRFMIIDVAKLRIPDDVMEYFRKTGAMGGKARAKRYTKEQLSEMGKKGGRPKGSGTKKAAATKKGGK